ncbi:MAG: TRAP transporter small permease [Gammaproteobacteria bacterium]|jgi:TRAP-type C4-dicarboxylate transport system permease small subunit
MKRRYDRAHRFEDALLVILLGGMILLAAAQILLRNCFDLGLLWIDPALRAMVLWLGLIGASIAGRENRHIRIDILSRLLGRQTNLAAQGLVTLFSASVCLLVAWNGARWLRFEYLDRLVGFAGIPVWLLEIVIPVSFTLMGVRYGFAAWHIGRYFYRRFGRRAAQRFRPAENRK